MLLFCSIRHRHFVFLLAIPLLRERPERDWWVLISTMLGVLCIFSQGTGDAIDGIMVYWWIWFSSATVFLLLSRENPVQTMAFNNLILALVLLPWVWDSLICSLKQF